MKTLTLILLLSIGTVCAQSWVKSPAFRGAAAIQASPTAPAGSADVTENFEGAGYENTWVEVNGAPGEDASTSGLGLEGSQCLYITAEAGAEDTYVAFTASDNAYAYFLLRIDTAPSGGGREQFVFKNGTTTLVMQAFTQLPAKFALYDGGETSTDTGTDTLSEDTTYHVWFEYSKGTGANAVMRVFYSTNGTKPGTADAEITNSDETAQANRLYFGNNWSGAGGLFYIDKLRISRTTAFGSNPS